MREKRRIIHGNACAYYVQKKKKKCIMGENPIQTTTLTFDNQSHNPRMREHMNRMLKHAMHEHVRS